MLTREHNVTRGPVRYASALEAEHYRTLGDLLELGDNHLANLLYDQVHICLHVVTLTLSLCLTNPVVVVMLGMIIRPVSAYLSVTTTLIQSSTCRGRSAASFYQL